MHALLAAFLLLSPSTASASHFRYGHINWAPANTSGTVAFTVTCAFRNGYGVNAIGQYFTETIGTTTFDFGDGQLTASTNWHVVGFQNGVDVVIARLDPLANGSDQVVHNYAGAGPYNAGIASCCRISDEINNPDGNYSVRTTVYPSFGGLGNSSPVSGMPPIIDMCTNQVNMVLVPAVDPDNNPLSFRLATPAEAGSGIFTQPGPPQAPNALSINAATGMLTWNTAGATLSGLGPTLYACQVVVEDGSSQVAVDFLINLVANCPGNHAPQFNYPPTPPNGGFFVACPDQGQSFSFTVSASDPDPGDVVTITHSGLPPGATLTCNPPSNPNSCVFNWTPTVGQIGNYVVNLTASDGQTSTLTSVNLKVDCITPSMHPSWGQLKRYYR